jgi:hypothetical protein
MLERIRGRIAELRKAEPRLASKLRYVDAERPSDEAGWAGAESPAYPVMVYARALHQRIVEPGQSPADSVIAAGVEFLAEALRLVAAADMARELLVTEYRNRIEELTLGLRGDACGVTRHVQQAIAPGFDPELDKAPPELL